MQATTEHMEIFQYRTNLGYFVKRKSNYAYETFENFIINGTTMKGTVHKQGWYCIESEITSVKIVKAVPAQIVSYVLINPELQSYKIPLRIPATCKSYDEDDDYKFVGEFEGLDSLYTAEVAEPTSEIIDVDFSVIDMGEYVISNPNDLTKREINAIKHTCVIPIDLTGITSYDEIVKLITPEFAMHDAECYLTSQQLYKIIRTFVNNNYDRQQAVITSDYDFCFTVKKLVKCKPFEHSIFTATGKRGNLKEKKVTKEHKEVEVFEMTWDKADQGRPYGKYTAIKPIKAKSLQDLYDRVTDYLQDLIALINTPVEECPHCNGTGAILSKFNNHSV